MVQELSRTNRSDVLQLVSQRYFLRYAARQGGSQQAVAFLHALPKRFHSAKTYNMVLQVCAAAGDIEAATLTLEFADKQRVRLDIKMLTSFINVCRSVGQATKAYSVFLDMKRMKLPLDAHVYGALLACFSEAMQREPKVAHERKDQYVLLEKAFSVIKDAQDNNVRLNAIAWNSVLCCAGRCGQLQRAFEVLETMQSQGIQPDVVSYGSLIEGCIQAGRPEVAMRLFERAMSEGFTQHVELYTQAVSACKLEGNVNLEAALGVYARMQRAGVAPDATFFSALIAVAGKAGQPERALEVLTDTEAEGISMDESMCSALIYACALHKHFSLARSVYDLCAAQGVYPQVSQYNRLMDWYASQHHLGDVVTLLSDMTRRARHKPNLNTYRVLLNACNKAEQGALAFDIFAVMKAQRIPILQEKFAHTLYYTLLKICFNMQRALWGAHQAAARSSPVVRLAEAERLLEALGSSVAARGKSSLLLQDATSATWAQYAVSAYRDMVAGGWRPTLDILDMLMGCLRVPLEKRKQQAMQQQAAVTQQQLQQQAAAAQRAEHAAEAAQQSESQSEEAQPQAPAASAAAAKPGRAVSRYEAVFDRRAVSLVEDAIARGFLPSFTVEQPCTLDLRMMPPTLAEVYTIAVTAALERRAQRLRAAATAEAATATGSVAKQHTGDKSIFFHRVTLLVPPFDPDITMWPSRVEKLHRHARKAQADAEAAAAASSSQAQATSPQHHQAGGGGGGAQPERQASGSEASTSHVSEPASALQAQRAREGRWAASSSEDSGTESADESAAADGRQQAGYTAGSNTGNAVAATCRRIKLFAAINPARGVITLDTREITKWIKAKRTWELRQSGQLGVQGAPQGAVSQAPISPSQSPEPVPAQSQAAHFVGNLRRGNYGSALMAQQRSIRTSGLPGPGMSPPGYHLLAPSGTHLPPVAGQHQPSAIVMKPAAAADSVQNHASTTDEGSVVATQ